VTIDPKQLRELVAQSYWRGEDTEVICEALPHLIAVYEAACSFVDSDEVDKFLPSTRRLQDLEDAVDEARKK